METRDEVLHDLLTPLAVMKGAISIVLKHGHRLTPEERNAWLELAVQQSDQLNALMLKMGGPDERSAIRIPDAQSAAAPPEPPATNN